MAIYTRQIAAMVEAGINLHRALSLQAETFSGRLGEISAHLGRSVSSGHTLSRSLSRYPEVFSSVYVSLVEVGETTGRLHEVLHKLADLQEAQSNIVRKFMSALTYPLVLLTVSLLGITLFVFYTLPQMMPLYANLGVDLPLPTRSLLWLKAVLPYLIAGFCLVSALFWFFWPAWRARASHRTLAWLDEVPLRLPILGKVIRKAIVSRILNAMATMLEVGVNFDVVLERSASVAGNRALGGRILKARKSLREGQQLSEALDEQGVLERAPLAFIKAGEEAGSGPSAMRDAARMCDYDVDYALTSMTSVLEPLVMALMGLLVGWIVLAAVLPMTRIIDRL